MSDTVALMWDCYGLEAVVNITERQRNKTWAILQGRDQTELPADANILHWKLRAIANPQRHYEIYLVEVEPDCDVDALREAFEADPQGMVDLIRLRGHPVFSYRLTAHDQRVRIR